MPKVNKNPVCVQAISRGVEAYLFGMTDDR